MSSVIYYAPVEKRFFYEWEYYQVDFELLQGAFPNVIVCHTHWQFLTAILSKKVDLVFAWWWHQSAIVVILTRLFRLPVVVTGAVHMYDESGSPDFFSKGLLYRMACRISWRFATRSLFISKSQQRQIASHEFVRNGVVLRSSLRKSFSVDELREHVESKLKRTTINMLTVVWMTKDQLIRKNVYESLKAVKLLVDEGNTDLRLTIAGGAADGTSDLRKTVEDLDLQNFVRIEVDVSENRKKDLYQEADLYIQPSYYEGFGNAVLEAMSMGLVPLVSRNTAQAEVVGDSGFVIEEIEAEFIAKAIVSYQEARAQRERVMESRVVKTINERHLFRYREEGFRELIFGDAP